MSLEEKVLSILEELIVDCFLDLGHEKAILDGIAG